MRWFRIQIGGRRLNRRTRESDLPDGVVKLYDARASAEGAADDDHVPTAEKDVFDSDTESDL